ncbi:MAG: nucleotide exchange factor GrpE [Ruminococcus sp.]|nr:nucleotide exchange factor GrpE [Ruminococcus sp.]
MEDKKTAPENNTPDEEIVNEELTEENVDSLSEEDSDEEDAVSEYNDTASEYAALEDALNEANDKYLRLFAEYDNYRKRTAREKTETYQNATAKCIEELLPFIDSFERSLGIESADENFKKGMDMIFKQLMDFLGKMNVREVDSLGAEFDPNIHNAIQQLDGTDYASNHVCQVYQKGYMIGDKLIRPAMVAVAL